ncbi:suppressor of fused domain protein [Paenibacillus sp. 481]|uniref:suppressor of fused domain protein n=1 Tax=Paenibacillus sp. 481 TaxID=2835869 RepID=UPI001E34CF5C|nr:suppressor of fused domain protein [Paenibacillus sp. 481]UHA72778.1 suppressor of fused domain protein [Paenibacillus sp. 481]
MSQHQPSAFSASGAPIYRHQQRNDVHIVSGNDETIQLVADHVEKYIGPISNVYHELISDVVHIDIFVVEPTPDRNYYTLVTCGMSELPMTVPEGAEEFRFAELMLCLPPDWKMSSEAFNDERNYWPIRWLKTLARLPHEYDSWLYIGHTIPNGDPAEWYAEDTELCGTLLGMPATVQPDFFSCQASADRTIYFYSVIPIYEEEMQFKLNEGIDPLYDKLSEAGVHELLDLKRDNTCKAKKRFWLF